MTKYFSELAGAFFLMLLIGMGASEFALIAGYVVLYQTLQPVSQAHFNPVVSWGFWLRNQLSTKDLLLYLLFQHLGVVLAAALSLYLRANQFLLFTPLDEVASVSVELLGSMAYLFVLLQAQSADRPLSLLLPGLGYGALHVLFQGVSGGYFNPALGLGICLMQQLHFDNLWIYWLSGLLGSSLAVYLHQFVTNHTLKSD
jgi:aquaporin Z